MVTIMFTYGNNGAKTNQYVPVGFEIAVTFPLGGSLYLDGSLSLKRHKAYKDMIYHLTNFMHNLKTPYLNSSNESSIRFLTNCIWYS